MIHWLMIIVVVVLSGCATQAPSVPVRLAPQTTPLQIADQHLLPGLNVTVMRFDADALADDSPYSAIAQVRSVERRLLPYLLKRTLERTGYWGAVRVMPLDDPNAELLVNATILESSGVELKLKVQVSDKTGRVWLNRVYEDVTSLDDYRDDPSPEIDPFQDLNNQIANDMAEVLLAMSMQDIDDLLTVTLLRYAIALSPESFERYLLEDAGTYSLRSLPAEDDPLMRRVLRIRESELLFVDSVDEHYQSLFQRVGLTYAWWRSYSFELIDGNRRLETVDARRGATQGSWYAMERVYKTYKESKMNEDALRELTVSFDRETAPTVAEVSGRIMRMNGSLDAQYSQWRELLRELYREETGR